MKNELKRIPQLLKDQNVGELLPILETMNISQLEASILSGQVPMEGWSLLNGRLEQARANKNLLIAETAQLSQRIQQLKRELNQCEAQYLQTQYQIQLADADKRRLIQAFANCEEKFIGPFKEKISDPEWSVESITLLDLNIAFSRFGIQHCMRPLVDIHLDSELILCLSFDYLKDVQLSLEDKLELLYVVDLISSKQFDRDEHKKICAVCASEDVEMNLREIGVAKDCLLKIKSKISGLKLHQVIFFPPTEIVAGIEKVSLQEKATLLRALTRLKDIHSSAIAQ